MKKIVALLAISGSILLSAQETANRFFYELTFKPKKEQAETDKVMTILDITKDKSLYRDYTMVAQDSLLKAEVEAMQKTGMYKDMSKTIKMPKFSGQVYKFYPSMKVQYVDMVANGFTPMKIGYNDDTKFNWKIENAKEKIGEYNAQKATTDFGGRKWTAWFSTDLPFQDGPYKFHGLPGLIVKIADSDNNYSWVLKGNKQVPNYSEKTFAETVIPGGDGGKVMEVSREKFEKTYNDYKKDPLATARPYMTAEVMSQKMPGSDLTIGEMVKQQEKQMNEFFNANNNPIEITEGAKKK